MHEKNLKAWVNDQPPIYKSKGVMIMQNVTKKKSNYGWIMMLLASLLGFAVMTFTVTPISLFVVPITKELGYARSSYTLTQTFQFAGVIISSLMFGSTISKYGVRKVITFGAILQAIGFFILSKSTSLPMFYTGGFLMGFASGFCAVSAASTIINTWFAKRSGFIVGLVFTFTSFGGIIWNPVIGGWIAKFGWRQAFLYIAMLVFGISILLALLLRDKPEDVGQVPVYFDSTSKIDEKKNEVKGMMFQEAIKTPKLKMLLLLIFLCGIAIPPTVATIPAYLNDLGLQVAVLWGVANSVVLFVNTISKIPLSAATDKYGVKSLISIALLGYVLAIVCMILAGPETIFFVFIAAGCMGFAVLMTSVPMPIIVRQFFGNKDFAKIMGVIFATFSVGQALATPTMNLVYDTLGSYKYVYYALLPTAVIIFALGWVATSDKPEHLIIKSKDSLEKSY